MLEKNVQLLIKAAEWYFFNVGEFLATYEVRYKTDGKRGGQEGTDGLR